MECINLRGEKEVADEKKAKEEAPIKVPIREVDETELEKVAYIKGKNKPFTNTAIEYYEDGQKM